MSLPVVSVPCRRRTMRFPAAWDVWVFWECDHHRDVSHVRDVSLAGLFLETDRCRPKGDSARVYFLVPEGQIRLDGIVTRAESGSGLGLKFKSITNEDIPQLTALITRIRCASPA
jgi:PilZ domain-containing protein